MVASEVGAAMDGWNFLEGPVGPRNELRRCSDEDEEQTVSAKQEIIVETLRAFPDAYRAVIERLRQIPLGGET